jgi:hypothetical protein
MYARDLTLTILQLLLAKLVLSFHEIQAAIAATRERERDPLSPLYKIEEILK